jgi:hypothetical protein
VAGASNPSKETAVTKNQAKRTLQGYYENLVDVQLVEDPQVPGVWAYRGNAATGHGQLVDRVEGVVHADGGVEEGTFASWPPRSR